MALTVRFPNGQEVTYNAAHHLVRDDDSWKLLDKNKVWVASVQASAGAIVGGSTPCRIENPLQKITLERALELLSEDVLQLGDYRHGRQLAELKRKLRAFDARTGEWK